MRFSVAALAVLASAPAPADIPDGRGVDVTQHGIFEIAPAPPPRAEFAPGMLAGVVREVPGVRLLQTTTTVCARLGVTFGMSSRLAPATPDDAWTVEVVIDHPPTTTTDGRTAASEHQSVVITHGSRSDLWSFDYPYELVPGQWTLSLVHHGTVIARQSFDVTPHCEAPVS